MRWLHWLVAGARWRYIGQAMRAPAVAAFLAMFAAACGGINVGPADGGGATDPDAAGAGDSDAGEEPLDLIDDLEDGDDRIIETSGRVGFWYTINDGTGVQDPFPEFVPSEGGAGGSAFSARTTGSDFTDWGAKLGLDLNQETEGDVVLGYDVSGHTGIRFWARGDVQVRAVIVSASVLDEALGGRCVPAEDSACDDHYGTPVALTGEWEEYELDFSEMAQVGWGQELPLDLSSALAIEFEIATNVASFDIAIDDVALY
jgi:hypothetical protein